MLENGLFFTPILFYTKQKLLAQMDKFIGYREKIREACEKINALQPKLIPEFRKYCYFTAKETRLEDLYFNSYPLITTEEYLLFSNAADAILHINTKVITQDNAPNVLDILHSREYAPADLIQLFEYFFSASTNTACITDPSTVKALVNGMDYRIFDVKSLNYTQRSQLYALIGNAYSTGSTNVAIELCKKFGCFVPELEECIAGDTDAKPEYLKLITEFDELSEVGLKWLESNYLTAPVSPRICEILLEKGWHADYIIANILRERKMVIDPNIDFSSYFDAYIHVDEVFDIMSDHWDFLEWLQSDADFSKLNEQHILPMFKVPQQKRFFSFILSNTTSPELKKRYLKEFYKFKSEDDSIAFQKLICQDGNLKLIDSLELKESISHRLWESNPTHKRLFTRFWNKEWADKLLKPQPV